MSTNKGVTISAATPKEAIQVLKSLEPGDVFRLPDVNFEDAVGGDETGGCFYWTTSHKKDGLVRVVSLDFKVERALPEETMVIQHTVHIGIVPNRD